MPKSKLVPFWFQCHSDLRVLVEPEIQAQVAFSSQVLDEQRARGSRLWFPAAGAEFYGKPLRARHRDTKNGASAQRNGNGSHDGLSIRNDILLSRFRAPLSPDGSSHLDNLDM